MSEQLGYYSNNNDLLTMEAIKWQGVDLFQAITKVLEGEMGKEPHTLIGKPIGGGALDKVVFQYTGLNCFFTVKDDGYRGNQKNYNAAVFPPSLSKNNVLLNPQDYWWSTGGDGRNALRSGAKKLNGLVDLKNSRVSGIFSTIRMTSFITVDLLLDTEHFTAEQKAAIVLHEIGHAFTWIETLVYAARVNMCIQAVNDTLRDTQDEKMLIELADGIGEVLNVRLDSKDLASSKDPKTWYTVFVKASIDERRLAANSGRYTDVASEFMADQFAVRHGAGVALVGAMHAMYKYYDVRELKTKAAMRVEYSINAVMITFSAVVGTLLFGPIGCVIVAAFIAWVTSHGLSSYNIYDAPMRRLQKMRIEQVHLVKDPTVSVEQKKAVSANMAEIDQVLKLYSANKSVDAYLAEFFNFREGKLAKVRDVQNALEDLMNNDVFLVASKISTIGK